MFSPMAFDCFRLVLSEGIYKEMIPHGIPDMIHGGAMGMNSAFSCLEFAIEGKITLYIK
jgi:hypothetical protein